MINGPYAGAFIAAAHTPDYNSHEQRLEFFSEWNLNANIAGINGPYVDTRINWHKELRPEIPGMRAFEKQKEKELFNRTMAAFNMVE